MTTILPELLGRVGTRGRCTVAVLKLDLCTSIKQQQGDTTLQAHNYYRDVGRRDTEKSRRWFSPGGMVVVSSVVQYRSVVRPSYPLLCPVLPQSLESRVDHGRECSTLYTPFIN